MRRPKGALRAACACVARRRCACAAWSFPKRACLDDVPLGAFEERAARFLPRREGHLEARGDDIAIIWEGDEPDQDAKITYRQLYKEVCRFAKVLKKQGVRKGDRVCLYMPMVPEAAYAMLACARIGAIHSGVFAWFSAEALRARIVDSQCKVVLTADEGLRATKKIKLKSTVDKALEEGCECVTSVLVHKRTGNPEIGWVEGRDEWMHEAMA